MKLEEAKEKFFQRKVKVIGNKAMGTIEYGWARSPFHGNNRC